MKVHAGRNALSRANGEDKEPRREVAVRAGGLQFEENEEDNLEEGEVLQKTVPLRCKPEKRRKTGLCGGCSKLVKDSAKTAVHCELRFGWWHLACVKPLHSFKRGFETRRAIMNKIVEAEGGNSYKMHWRGEKEK